MQRAKLLLIILSLAALVGSFSTTHAGVTQTDTTLNGTQAIGYHFDKQEAVFRSIAVVDTLTSAGILATDEFPCGNRTTIPVSARFSASGQTCKVIVFYVWKNGSMNYIKGRSAEVTLTGGTTQYAAVYMAPDYLFDTEGATHVRLVMTTAPLSGTVDFWTGSY